MEIQNSELNISEDCFIGKIKTHSIPNSHSTRLTDIQQDRQTDRHTDIERERQRDRHTYQCCQSSLCYLSKGVAFDHNKMWWQKATTVTTKLGKISPNGNTDTYLPTHIQTDSSSVVG